MEKENVKRKQNKNTSKSTYNRGSKGTSKSKNLNILKTSEKVNKKEKPLSSNNALSRKIFKNRSKKIFKNGSIRVAFLGGLNEIGKNITLFECGNDMFLLDCGMAFPDVEMLGVDLVIPDFSYVEKQYLIC